jgi:hypothetical protein
MSTIQQVGYALGVAVTGVIFFGAADEGIAKAFELSLIQMAVVSAGIVAMSLLLPRPPQRERTSVPPITEYARTRTEGAPG